MGFHLNSQPADYDRVHRACSPGSSQTSAAKMKREADSITTAPGARK